MPQAPCPKEAGMLNTSHLSETGLDELLDFITFSNEFRATERLIWYKGNPHRELDGDHSFQIAFVAWYIISRFKLELDVPTVVMMALVHDLPEFNAGDTHAFEDPTGVIPNGPSPDTKEERERVATEDIVERWGKEFPDMVKLLLRYQAHACPESRFIYALDKLVSTANIFLDEGNTWHRLKVSLDKLDAYKWHKVGAHNIIEGLYDELVRRMEADPSLFPHDD